MVEATAHRQRGRGEHPRRTRLFAVLAQRRGHVQRRALAAETTLGEFVPEHVAGGVMRVFVVVESGDRLALAFAQPARKPRGQFARAGGAGIQTDGRLGHADHALEKFGQRFDHVIETLAHLDLAQRAFAGAAYR